MINIIVAMDKNQIIGLNNDLPWKLSGDLKYFKEITSNKIVVMGRKTYESIGKPLPNRTNIVLTKDSNLRIDGVEICNSILDILKRSYEYINEDIYIIGGSEIYKAFLPYVNRLYITMIDDEIFGDTRFPEFKDKFKQIDSSETKNEIDKKNNAKLTYEFTIWEKK